MISFAKAPRLYVARSQKDQIIDIGDTAFFFDPGEILSKPSLPSPSFDYRLCVLWN